MQTIQTIQTFTRIAIVIFITMFFMSSVSQAVLVFNGKVYKTIHTDGSVTYSDQASPGATEVVLSVPTSTFESSAKTTAPTMQRKQKPQINHSVNILSPQAEETIRSNAGEISIHATIEPKLGGFFQLHINDQIHESATGMFRLTNMDRGTYQYIVKFIDNTGKVIASSESRNVYLHQASALIN
jgi:hypothetical protein